MKKVACFLVLLLLFTTFAPAAWCYEAQTPPDGMEFVSPGFYRLWNGGNCVWFAWEMAYQVWGVRLPWAGDARNWTGLAGDTVTVNGKVYQIEAVREPEPNSIMVFQPKALRWLNGGKSFKYDYLGHVAWVTDVDNAVILQDGRKLIWKQVHVLESGVYPPKHWPTWHGCRYMENFYFWKEEGIPGVVFLVLKNQHE